MKVIGSIFRILRLRTACAGALVLGSCAVPAVQHEQARSSPKRIAFVATPEEAPGSLGSESQPQAVLEFLHGMTGRIVPLARPSMRR